MFVVKRVKPSIHSVPPSSSDEFSFLLGVIGGKDWRSGTFVNSRFIGVQVPDPIASLKLQLIVRAWCTSRLRTLFGIEIFQGPPRSEIPSLVGSRQ